MVDVSYFYTKFEDLKQHFAPQNNRKASVEDSSDPSQGLMNILKKIYSEGDDEMKRTLNKAWTESQEKRRGDTMDF